MEKKDSEEGILYQNIKKFINSADLVYKTEDYTSATILYFKALFAILDLIILKKEGRLPKDHSERFRMLEISHNELYIILDKTYEIYRNAYNMIIKKEDCNNIKDNVNRIIKEQRI